MNAKIISPRKPAIIEKHVKSLPEILPPLVEHFCFREKSPMLAGLGRRASVEPECENSQVSQCPNVVTQIVKRKSELRITSYGLRLT